VSNLPHDLRKVLRGGLTGLVAADFGPIEQKLIHAFKEDGQTALSKYLAQPLASLLLEISKGYGGALLVPVPSSRQNYKKRGYRPTVILGRAVNRLAKQPCLLSNTLYFTRQVVDQSTLDSSARKANLDSAMYSKPLSSGCPVILFDDVITTGSTILEAARAITVSGGKVIGFLAFAETILKTGSKN
jgi:predicted amidophosphoribosyltransferase